MALVLRKSLFERCDLLFQSKRFRGKINIQRPKPVHFERAVFIALTKPYFINPNKNKPLAELCNKLNEKKVEVVENPLERIIAKELRQSLENSKLVGFYHMNPINPQDNFKVQNHFKKANMQLKVYGKKTLQVAVKDSRFKPLLDFYVSRNCMVFSPEPDIKQMIKVSKKFPQLVLLCALFEGKLINREEITMLEMIPNLASAQAGLVQTLNSAASNLAQQLEAHQTSLVTQLDQRKKQLAE